MKYTKRGLWNSVAYKTEIATKDHEDHHGGILTFEGIHDFKVGSCYTIKVRQYNGELISFDKVTELGLSDPKKYHTYQVTVDEHGNRISIKEVKTPPQQKRSPDNQVLLP